MGGRASRKASTCTASSAEIVGDARISSLLCWAGHLLAGEGEAALPVGAVEVLGELVLLQRRRRLHRSVVMGEEAMAVVWCRWC